MAMADEPSAKRQCGETSNQSSNLDDVHVPCEKCACTKTLKGVDLHGKETLEVVCTSKPDKDNEMIDMLWRKAGGMFPRFVGVHVEYTKEDEPLQRAAVLELCMEQLYLVYHIAAAKKWPKRIKDMVRHEKLFTFAGFCIGGDKEKLKLSGLEINPNKYIDIQCNCRVPSNGGKKYDSLADVVGSVIHPFYKTMKKKIDKKEDHKLGGSAHCQITSSSTQL
ncbi:hypothetical protein VPH35_128797 [Triticum aestivum]